MPMDRTACDIMRLTFVRGGVFALLSGMPSVLAHTARFPAPWYYLLKRVHKTGHGADTGFTAGVLSPGQLPVPPALPESCPRGTGGRLPMVCRLSGLLRLIAGSGERSLQEHTAGFAGEAGDF